MERRARACFAALVDFAAIHERELADACARGVQNAWRELLRRCDRKVLQALRKIGLGEEAEDLRQEVWTRLLADDRAALRRFRAEREGSLRFFVAQVARRVGLDHLRSGRARPPALGGADPSELVCAWPNPERAICDRRSRCRLATALEAAARAGEHPARDGDILRLHFLEGYAPGEIAQMGVGLGTRGVEALLRRARGKLAELLADEP